MQKKKTERKTDADWNESSIKTCSCVCVDCFMAVNRSQGDWSAEELYFTFVKCIVQTLFNGSVMYVFDFIPFNSRLISQEPILKSQYEWKQATGLQPKYTYTSYTGLSYSYTLLQECKI